MIKTDRILYLELAIGFLAYNLAVLVPIYLFPPAAGATHSIPVILLLFFLAAAISALFFGLAHLHLFLILDPLVAGIATLLVVVSHFPFAYLYERGRNTIWAGSIVHIAATGLGGNIFVIPPESSSMALSLFLVVIMISPYLVFLFFRRERGYQPSTLNVQEV
jgi:hypothetical protein